MILFNFCTLIEVQGIGNLPTLIILNLYFSVVKTMSYFLYPAKSGTNPLTLSI